jgi:hypothetical protein
MSSVAIADPGPVVAARIRISSVAAVARELRLARETVARIAAGLPVRAGTLSLVRERLSEAQTP